MRSVVGADACRTGWVVVRLVDGQVEDVEVVDELDAATPGCAAIGVDIPIGLIDGPRRDADVAARRLLPGRASSVFGAPPRAVVDAWRRGELSDHASASALAVERTGLGLSQQAWRIVPSIAEVDALAAGLVAAGTPPALLEVHPELAFAAIVGAPLPRKRSWPGLTTRRAVLERHGIVLPDRFPGDDRAAPDDVLDAAVCAWVADGSAIGAPLLSVPDDTAQRDHGRPIVITARIAPSPSRPGPHGSGGPLG